MAPSLLILGVFVVYPIGISFWYSLHDWTIGAPEQPFVGLDNYRALASDTQFRNALVNTLELTVVSVVVLVVLGLALALALIGEGRMTRVVRSAFFFPTIVSLTSIGLVWRFLLDPDLGLVGGISSALHIPRVDWLQSTSLALPTVIFVDIWKNAGFVMVILLGALKAVPAERIEAARLDGAGRWQLVRHILVPSIRPTLLFATLILTIQSLQLFDLVYVMTGGGPLFATDTLVNQVFREGFVNFRTGYASAISWVLFVLIMLVSAVQLRVFRYDDVD
ncbi:carbohydrate ABC transporter permease [Luteipulveratus flavus]|uniref:Sugar ABC transporter permease n=1 Tax=Luteipulveratus flavus TaxID=3031728 RepID=A0ABT6C227_9MICO|nr:sugar ABC transporter permease [Luteipulveratus sp. YIM 133296]MDF8262953.1 sugar ABC transporter permease [Luteipulveratus sp. YIM 133296]